MVGREDEAAVAVILVVVDAGRSQATLDQLAFQVVGYGAAPAALEDDIALDRLEVLRSEGSAVVEAEGEGPLGDGSVLLQVHVGLEDLGEQGEVG